MQPPELNVIVLVVIVVLTVAIGGWYFLLRGSGQQSEFLRAHDRFVAAEHDAEAAMAKVTRFIELEEFDATVLAQIKVMEHQAAVFKRLAGEGDDEEARLADKAAGVSDRVITATKAYSYALLRRPARLAQAAAAVVDMQAGIVELDGLVTEWNNLQ